MATPAVAPTGAAPTTTNQGGSRGKHQIHWSEGVWKALDHAVIEEMRRTRVAAKFLPHVHVEKKQTNVAADVVISPGQAALLAKGAPPADPALFVDESQTNRVQEYWVTFRMSPAQVEEEEHTEALMGHHEPPAHHMDMTPPHSGPVGAHPEHHHMMNSHRASTGCSLAMRTANVLAQAEDLILFNGAGAVAYAGLFTGSVVQALDKNLLGDLDLGLLNIKPVPNAVAGQPPIPTITLPSTQVVVVHPVPPPGGAPAPVPPRYAENTLNAVAQAFSTLQGLGHYEHYALALHTIPYADLHEALPTTLIEPVEPISHLIKAGIYGSGTFPPFDGATAGIPTQIFDANGVAQPLSDASLNNTWGKATKVLYTGVLVSLSGNTMDHVRGKMEDHLDVIVTFNQKDQNEQYRFRVVERFCLRLKDPSAVILLLFVDQ
jgi:uncharacterized linocin/CFP29 family protein